MTETTDEELVTYEDRPPARVIAIYRDVYGNVDLRDWMILPGSEESVAAQVEDNPEMMCFFVELSTDMSAIETIPLEQYLAFKEAQAAEAADEEQTEEV